MVCNKKVCLVKKHGKIWLFILSPEFPSLPPFFTSRATPLFLTNLFMYENADLKNQYKSDRHTINDDINMSPLQQFSKIELVERFFIPQNRSLAVGNWSFSVLSTVWHSTLWPSLNKKVHRNFFPVKSTAQQQLILEAVFSTYFGF